MSERKISTFEFCHCPYCSCTLHEVSTKMPACPACNKPLDARAVWMTKRYPGQLVLPGWLAAFGWPLLLMLLGFGLFLLGYFGYFPIPLKLPVFLIGVGMVYFIAKLATDGEKL